MYDISVLECNWCLDGVIKVILEPACRLVLFLLVFACFSIKRKEELYTAYLKTYKCIVLTKFNALSMKPLNIFPQEFVNIIYSDINYQFFYRVLSLVRIYNRRLLSSFWTRLT